MDVDKVEKEDSKSKQHPYATRNKNVKYNFHKDNDSMSQDTNDDPEYEKSDSDDYSSDSGSDSDSDSDSESDGSDEISHSDKINDTNHSLTPKNSEKDVKDITENVIETLTKNLCSQDEGDVSRGRKRFRNEKVNDKKTENENYVGNEIQRPVRNFIKNPVMSQYNDDEIIFYKKMTAEQKEQIAKEEKKMIDLNDTKTPIRFKILRSQIADHIKAIAIKKLNYLYELDPSSGEYFKTFSWIENVCRLPIGYCKQLPFNSQSTCPEIKKFLNDAKNHMDCTVYGHIDAKQQIIRLLAQWIVNPESKGMVIGIHGPMGCGKTTLIKDSICKVLKLPFAFIPLGGASDSCYLEGHSYTYEGATWGKIVDVLMKSQCMNPVFYFDELDKISNTSKGDEIVNILMHITDLSQNDKFQDKYFIDFEFDISKSLIIFSYNHEEAINPILRDRMIRIKTEGYNIHDKITIVQKYILPEILIQYKFDISDIIFNDDIIRQIISNVENEDGVRNLKRGIDNIVSNINLKRLTEEEPLPFPYFVKGDDIKTYLKTEKKDDKIPFMYT